MLKQYECCPICQTKPRRSLSGKEHYYCPVPNTINGSSHYETDGKSYSQVKTQHFTFVFSDLRTHVTYFPIGSSYCYHEYIFGPGMTYEDVKDESKMMQLIEDYEIIK